MRGTPKRTASNESFPAFDTAPAVCRAGEFQFAPGQTHQNGCVQSRASFWCKSGHGTFRVNGRELLFNVTENPGESVNCLNDKSDVAARLRTELAALLAERELTRPALAGDRLRVFPFEPFPRVRIKQFGRGVTDFGQGPIRA